MGLLKEIVLLEVYVVFFLGGGDSGSTVFTSKLSHAVFKNIKTIVFSLFYIRSSNFFTLNKLFYENANNY